MQKDIIFVNGTNGSGKSTLAKTIIQNCDGVEDVYELKKRVYITHCKNGVCVLGKYDTQCGGLDGFDSWEGIQYAIEKLNSWGVKHILGEGFITYSFDKYLALDDMYNGNLHYISLSTPIKICIEQVKKRRKEKGNTEEFNPENLYKKAKGAYGLYINLLMNGLKHAELLSFDLAYEYIKKQFGFMELKNEHNS